MRRIGTKEESYDELKQRVDELAALNRIAQTVTETIAAQIAGAIENARLYAAVQQEMEERKRIENTLAEEQNL